MWDEFSFYKNETFFIILQLLTFNFHKIQFNFRKECVSFFKGNWFETKKNETKQKTEYVWMNSFKICLNVDEVNKSYDFLRIDGCKSIDRKCLSNRENTEYRIKLIKVQKSFIFDWCFPLNCLPYVILQTPPLNWCVYSKWRSTHFHWKKI